MTENQLDKSATRVTTALYAFLTVQDLLEGELKIFLKAPYDNVEAMPAWAPLTGCTANWCFDLLDLKGWDANEMHDLCEKLGYKEILPRAIETMKSSGKTMVEALWLSSLVQILDRYIALASSLDIVVANTPVELLRAAVAEHLADHYPDVVTSQAQEIAEAWQHLAQEEHT